MTEALLLAKPVLPVAGEFLHSRASKRSSFTHRHQTGNCWRKLIASSGASASAISGRRLPLFRRLVNSRKLKAIIRTSASVGAMRRSRCRPRRSRDCMRTTSSWPPKSTSYSLGRPRRERVLYVLQLAPFFRYRARSSMFSRLKPRCDSAPRGIPPQDRHGKLMCFKQEDNKPGCSQQGSGFDVRLQSRFRRIPTGKGRRQANFDKI